MIVLNSCGSAAGPFELFPQTHLSKLGNNGINTFVEFPLINSPIL
jgi:hypothetical protein